MIFRCSNCRKSWRYPINICLFCGQEVQEEATGSLVVHAVTEVDIPSTEHDRVPYFNVLLRDENDNFFLRKHLHKVTVGEEFIEETGQEQNLKIGIVGTGIMGTGLGALFLQYGYPLTIIGRSEASLDRSRSKIRNLLVKLLEEDETDSRLENTTFEVETATLAECDLIIESIAEDLAVKQQLLKKIEQECSAVCIIATNTSSLSINELSSVLRYPQRFLGLHFFNPVDRMQLVEVVKGTSTSSDTIKKGTSLVESLAKSPVAVNDSPCFIVNRVLMPFLNEAVRIYDDKAASPEDIDKAVVLGLNHPIGPLALIDLIGVDIFVKIMQNLSRSLGSGYDPGQAALELVEKNHTGRKSGAGFYNYL